MIFLRLLYESFRFAWSAIKHNPLRTILSLTGVTIGIFAIIAALTVVDSLKKNIVDSLSFLGTEVLYVEKWPYIFDGDAPFWKYQKRPMVTFNEYRHLEANLKNATASCVYVTVEGRTIKRESNSIGGITIMGVTEGHPNIYELKIDKGRFFTRGEINNGSNLAIIGFKIKQALFPGEDPIGKEIVMKGLKFTVIGTIEEEGQSLLNTPSNDVTVMLSFRAFRKMYHTSRRRGGYTSICVKGYPSDEGLVELENEIRGLLRAYRGLKPKDEDDFAINRPEAINNVLDGVFKTLTIAGGFIGIFSILVGAFGIANIMFVSVNERTNIIGIQKSLGAKNYFILFQFLFESVFLSLLGGGFGLFFVYLGTLIPLGSFEITLMLKNIILGIGISTAIGVLSGIIPAQRASRLDPVEAIRSK